MNEESLSPSECLERVTLLKLVTLDRGVERLRALLAELPRNSTFENYCFLSTFSVQKCEKWRPGNKVAEMVHGQTGV